MTKSEEICRMLGIELVKQPANRCGDFDCLECYPRNPDFEGEFNDAGRVQLLRLMKERKDWYGLSGRDRCGFVMKIGHVSEDWKGKITYFINTDYILTDGPLVEAVLGWLKAKPTTDNQRRS